MAVAATAAGKTGAVIDLDPQPSAANWGDRRSIADSPAVIACPAARLRPVLDGARNQGVDLVIIDTPGKSADAQIQLISGHESKKSQVYQHLSLESVDKAYQDAVQTVRGHRQAGKFLWDITYLESTDFEAIFHRLSGAPDPGVAGRELVPV